MKFIDLISKLYYKWSTTKPLGFIIITGLLITVFTLPFAIPFTYLNISSEDIGGPDQNSSSITLLIVGNIILAPTLETLIGQMAPIYLSYKIFNKHPRLIGMTLSIVVFSLLHLSYSIWYAILVIPAGYFLAESYIIYRGRKESSYWVTAVIHAFRNLIAISISFL